METKITIVYDNCLNERGLKTGWGFSALIEINHTSPILFDTGDDGVALLYNMEQLGIAPERIGTIVISHAHGDHTGIGAILDAASSHGKIYGIIGGLHSFRDFSRLDVLSLICPCHCTQYKDELERRFSEQVVECGAGLELVLS